MEKIAYVVTDTAGPKVAGRRVTPGEELLLTEFEARSELLAGSLRPKTNETAAAAIATDEGPIAVDPAPDAPTVEPAVDGKKKR